MIIQTVAVLAITAWYYWPLAILLALLFPVYMWLTALTSKRWQKFEATKNPKFKNACMFDVQLRSMDMPNKM